MRFLFFSTAGGDIAELMLDFIEWLTQQDFGRRCILSVRDVLSWVYFLNTVCERDEDGFMTMGALEEDEEAEWNLRLDTVTAFIHAACLVYVDGIGSGKSTVSFSSTETLSSQIRCFFFKKGDLRLHFLSGTTASCADSAILARQLCLDYLQQQLSKIIKLDQEMLDALRVYDSSLSREPQWGDDFFGIDPFYIALGTNSTYITATSNGACPASIRRENVQLLFFFFLLPRASD